MPLQVAGVAGKIIAIGEKILIGAQVDWSARSHRRQTHWRRIKRYELVDWAYHLLDDVGCNVRVACRGVQLRTAVRNLNDADVDVMLKRMRREGLPERVRQPASKPWRVFVDASLVLE